MSVYEPRKLLTVREVAELLGVHEQTVYRRVWAGEIPALRVGESEHAPIRVDPDELAAWIRDDEER